MIIRRRSCTNNNKAVKHKTVCAPDQDKTNAKRTGNIECKLYDHTLSYYYIVYLRGFLTQRNRAMATSHPTEVNP